MEKPLPQTINMKKYTHCYLHLTENIYICIYLADS